MDSILQKNTERCLICHSHNWLEWHHVYGNAYRTKAGDLGLVVRLCHYCHNEPPNGIHHNRENRRKLQAFAQKKAMEQYEWDIDRFIKEFGKNYL